MDENTLMNISVLSNDTDDEGDTLSITNLTNPTHGTVTISGTDVVYEPTVDYTGTDTFTYTPNDGTDDGNTTTVTITVNEVSQSSSSN